MVVIVGFSFLKKTALCFSAPSYISLTGYGVNESQSITKQTPAFTGNILMRMVIILSGVQNKKLSMNIGGSETSI